MDYIDFYDSPLGKITLASEACSINGLWFEGQKNFAATLSQNHKAQKLAVFDEAKSWLDVYFSGREPPFFPRVSFPQNATLFQKRVWACLLEIPYAKTCSYKTIAEKLSGVNYARAVASAIGKNPVTLLVPCHRVLGAHGNLTGYAGGLERKQYLLRLESRTQSFLKSGNQRLGAEKI